ncbi:MAG TPA: VOC family protein [Magnetospirillaceae bacterium]|nr:VOC family protein [Magnetospirillaceae bacterium]
MQKITTFLTFQEKGAEAVRLYTSLFKNSHITNLTEADGKGPISAGALMHAEFTLDGQQFYAMDGGPSFTFGIGMSLMVKADDQAEIDRLWLALSEGGKEMPCGWLEDKYGVAWQIVPPILGTYLMDADPAKAERVTKAMLGMHKIIIQDLQDAYEGK